MSIPQQDASQQLFHDSDFGCTLRYQQELRNLWPDLLEIVRKQLNNPNLTLLQVKQHIISNKQTVKNPKNFTSLDGTPLAGNPVTNPYFNGIIRQALERSTVAEPTVVLPQDEKVVYIQQVKQEELKPKLDTKESKSEYYYKNPDKFLFYLKGSDRQFPLFTTLALVPIFQIVSTQDRLKIGDDEHRQRYTLAEGNYEVQGPVLCCYDFKILCSLLHMYACSKEAGVSVFSDLSEISRCLNKDSKVKSSKYYCTIKSSLDRLQKTQITFNTNGHLPNFTGSLLKNGASDELFSTVKTSRTKKLHIELNDCFVNHFIFNGYTKANLDVILDLNSYELRLYCYLLVRGFKGGISYKLSTIFNVLYSNQRTSVSEISKIKSVGSAINSLIDKGLLDPESQLIKSKSFSKESHYFLSLSDDSQQNK
jgi:hypothetical protein